MKCVVLLSGGIDSTVLLADRIACGHVCHALTFNYGQLNAHREFHAAKMIAAHYDVEHTWIPISPIMFGHSALFGTLDMPDGHANAPDATVVAGRNIVLLSAAAAFASSVGATAVMFGANRDDAAGYADCRPEFIDHIDEAAYWSHKVRVSAPLLFMTKHQIVERGRELSVPLQHTWSCYEASGPCGRCGACELRKQAGA